jgi:hypothetical protein
MAQGCQIFLCPNIPKRGNYTKLLQTITNIRNGRNELQMVKNYTKILQYIKALQNTPKLGFSGTNVNHLATLLSREARLVVI